LALQQALDVRIQKVNSCCNRVESLQKARESDLIISNTHKQKGNEYATVIMSNDFAKLRDGADFVSSCTLQDHFNLIYVAMTRACDVLVLNRDLDYLVFRYLRPPVAALRLPWTVNTECCLCGGAVEGATESLGGGSGSTPQGSWAASTRRWGLNIAISKDRHARGHVLTHPGNAAVLPSACCSLCLSSALKEPIRPSWAQKEVSPEGLAEFWGPQVLPPVS
jgi:hypothetical protein